MRETLELRVVAREAPGIFEDDEGVELSPDIRKITIRSDDPRLGAIQERQALLHQDQRSLYFGWIYARHYTKAELDAARFFVVTIGWSKALAGDIAGTVYDTASACPVCGAGRGRLSPLRLRLGEVPRVHDIVRSISGEWIVSERFKAACEAAGATGATFSPVEFRRVPDDRAPQWFELGSSAPRPSMLGGTRFATEVLPDPDRDQRYRCPLGDTVGFRRISEVVLAQAHAPDYDVVESRESTGAVNGSSIPNRELMLSARLHAALKASGIRGSRWRSCTSPAPPSPQG